jgi:hypothetical protein
MANETTSGTASEPLTNGGGGMSPRAVAGDLGARAGNLAGHAPEAMNSAVGSAAGVISQSTAAMQSSSDEVLAIGAALSTGVAIGLILGGAPRLLVGAALIPSAAMGFTLLTRYTEVRERGSA